MGEGELKTGGASRPSILADAVEAILGGVFLDGGFDVAVATVERVFARDFAQIDQLEPIKDAKTALQEWLQARKRPLPEYTVLRIEGEAHKQIFYVQCQIDSADLITIGQGGSRRAAEQDAAGLAIHELQSRSQVKKQ
jgi:ribonuclease-3